MSDRPNIIVIVSDTFRPDHIGASGSGKAETPELDAFLAKSVTFDKATVASFPTIPMRTDCFTGRFGHTRYPWQDLTKDTVTLPRVLSRNGYTTQLIADTTHMLRAKFWEHFDHFQFFRGHEMDQPFSRLNDPVERVVKDRTKARWDEGVAADEPIQVDMQPHTNFWQHYEDQSHAAVMSDRACRWVEDNYLGGPFMLWLDYFDVHEPWFPPRYLIDKYHPGYTGDPMPQPNYADASAYTPDELKDLQARYAAMCTLLSKQVGRVLRVMSDTGLMESTIVVFMSDHGTLLGEYGHTGKTIITRTCRDVFPLHPEISRICWSMYVPESLKGTAVKPGTKLDHLVQPPDLMPTLLDLAGVDAPEEPEMEGVSLVPVLRGESDEPPRTEAISGHSGGIACTDDGYNAFHYCRRPAITDGEWSLFIMEPPYAEAPQLYHTAEDPGHECNVIAENMDVARRLHAKLIEFIKTHDGTSEPLKRLTAANCGLE